MVRERQIPSVILTVSNDLTADQRLYKTCLTFLKAGYQVHVVGRKMADSHAFRPKGYDSTRLNLLFSKGPLFYAELNIRLFFLLLVFDADVFYSNDLDTLPANFLASRLRRKKLIYDSHEYFTEVPELQGRKLVQRIWGWLERLMLPHVKHSFTVCESVANEYHKKYGISMQVMRNCPLAASYSMDEDVYDPGRKIVIYQGALNKGRGLEVLIEAMPYVPEAQLWIFGGGDLEKELKKMANEGRICNQITFYGKLPFQQLREYTRQGTLGVSLEENLGLNYYYALPNKLFDYVHAGVPVLVSPFPEMSWIVDEYGVGAKASYAGAQELAIQLRGLLDDAGRLEQWHRQCLRVAGGLTWEQEEVKLLQLLKQWSV